ncbi:SRPBCC family protein [Halobacteriaceae archaeon GCM10025711]
MAESSSVRRSSDGAHLLVSRVVDASADHAWDVLTDTTRWPEWGPSVSAVECEDRYIEAGTTGRVRTLVGVRVPFEVTRCAPYYWTWRVARVPATGHRVEPLADGTCRVTLEVPVPAAPYVPVCLLALRRIARLVSPPPRPV